MDIPSQKSGLIFLAVTPVVVVLQLMALWAIGGVSHNSPAPAPVPPIAKVAAPPEFAKPAIDTVVKPPPAQAVAPAVAPTAAPETSAAPATPAMPPPQTNPTRLESSVPMAPAVTPPVAPAEPVVEPTKPAEPLPVETAKAETHTETMAAAPATEPVKTTPATEPVKLAQPPTVEPAAPAPDDIAWLNARDPRRYTLQVQTGGDPNRLREFAGRNTLADTAIYRVARNGNPRYILVSGDFGTRQAARQAAARLTSRLPDLKPVLSDFATIHRQLR